ncbi:hypothetical protein FVE85_5467 [Porphyridium purpureum]|uniref:Uncharacterized protein n=1 Tax=Porphyridium purpureum TaxID=35688 RepID=A0A5J4Z407_PORPP|nr:hypothetical protein FVE85_5467 [Porphyridium purpureum]|eukprot:POR0948..scf295_1
MKDMVILVSLLVGTLLLATSCASEEMTATLEVFPDDDCVGNPVALNLTLGECQDFLWSDPKAPVDVESVRLVELKCGPDEHLVKVTGYPNPGCAGMPKDFLLYRSFGNALHPDICVILSTLTTGFGNFLYRVKVDSYSCGDGPVPSPTPSPTPAPTPSPTATPTATADPSDGPARSIWVCEYSSVTCTEGERCYVLMSNECTTYNGHGSTPYFKYNYTCGVSGASSVGGGYYEDEDCVPSGNFSADIDIDQRLELNTCYVASETLTNVGEIRARRFKEWACTAGSMTSTPLPSNVPTPTPTPVPVCVDSEWMEKRGLGKVHAGDGVGEMLCITGLDDLPCGTPNHVIEVTKHNGARTGASGTSFRTYAEVCAERDCTTKVGRFNGVLHSDAHLLPSQDGHRLTTVAHRGTTWSEVENWLVLAAQKMRSPRVNRLLAYLQRRNSVAHLAVQQNR